MHVPLLDLKLQYNSLKPELDAAVQKVIESQYFILGPEVEKMEQLMNAYIGCSYSLGISSGTDALLLALMAIDIQPGDEVIVPTYSFFATAGVVVRLNAVPIFVDVDPVTFNIDPKKITPKITSRTKAIIPVHLYGQSADMDSIMSIAKEHKLFVIEDGAQAIGVHYKDGRKAGAIGDIGCFSFFPSKNLGCFGDGGLVTTNNPELAERMKYLRVHGMNPKYYHKYIGGNFRIDALQAAVLSVKLPHLDQWSSQRRTNAGLYLDLFRKYGLAENTGKTVFDSKNRILLPHSTYQKSGVKNHHIFNQYIIRVEKRNALKKFITERGIGNDIYYPVPFHEQECFKYLNQGNDFPVSNCAAHDSLALPIFPELTREQIEYVVSSIAEFMEKHEASFPQE
ncbi:MAG: DegT/DnrJ/EryC1/StrS family aminotransferase [Bacteroidota bacterium]|nr:DegT/DnrJ/EryC1/StrS family aminotransferase [Bacteroidota bacterium]